MDVEKYIVGNPSNLVAKALMGNSIALNDEEHSSAVFDRYLPGVKDIGFIYSATKIWSIPPVR